jgi:hypothetical protein
MLAAQVRAVENSGARNTLLRAIRVLLGRRADPDKETGESSTSQP